MEVKTNIEYSFTADFVTYHVLDDVKVKTRFLQKRGKITKINFVGFEIAINGNDERLVFIKYEDLVFIEKSI